MENPFLLDFHSLIAKADKIRQNLWGTQSFFVKNLHLNYTNICVNHCKFCAYAKNVGEDGSYFMSPDYAVKYVEKNGIDANEIHIVGGLHPDYKFDYYLDLVHALKSAYPKKTIKAFSAVEIFYFSQISGKSVEEVLKDLNKAGVEMLPGGGAEIFEPKVRNLICPEKISSEVWLNVHEIAHKIGMQTNATMLYGHLESDIDKFNHLMTLRALQERTKGFSAFIALSFQPDKTFLDGKSEATGVESIRTIAASRIVLDNVPHIKAYWVMLGAKTAQIALRAGADDLDGTIEKENIARAAGGKTATGMTIDALVSMIKDAKLTPIERDSFYKEIKNYG